MGILLFEKISLVTFICEISYLREKKRRTELRYMVSWEGNAWKHVTNHG